MYFPTLFYDSVFRVYTVKGSFSLFATPCKVEDCDQSICLTLSRSLLTLNYFSASEHQLPVSHNAQTRSLQAIDPISQIIMLRRAVEDASTGSDSDYSK